MLCVGIDCNDDNNPHNCINYRRNYEILSRAFGHDATLPVKGPHVAYHCFNRDDKNDKPPPFPFMKYGIVVVSRTFEGNRTQSVKK